MGTGSTRVREQSAPRRAAVSMEKMAAVGEIITSRDVDFIERKSAGELLFRRGNYLAKGNRRRHRYRFT